ncbi:11141_t:CDS:1 [Paraglomus occultum]|uniref:11141_t:CDS:1 n=1 Tax=Paraglomus occultum TaxID=144539 RepID=A0A9N8ZL42_9GLOM|nr:11141_t:CDS:1 [Paraglomus occultum]
MELPSQTSNVNPDWEEINEWDSDDEFSKNYTITSVHHLTVLDDVDISEDEAYECISAHSKPTFAQVVKSPSDKHNISDTEASGSKRNKSHRRKSSRYNRIRDSKEKALSEPEDFGGYGDDGKIAGSSKSNGRRRMTDKARGLKLYKQILTPEVLPYSAGDTNRDKDFCYYKACKKVVSGSKKDTSCKPSRRDNKKLANEF